MGRKIVLLNNDKKTTIAKNSPDRSAFEEKTAGILFKLSENAIGYVISNLMHYHHFKKARPNHIHIECEGKNHKTYNLTLFFEDDQEPIIGGITGRTFNSPMQHLSARYGKKSELG